MPSRAGSGSQSKIIFSTPLNRLLHAPGSCPKKLRRWLPSNCAAGCPKNHGRKYDPPLLMPKPMRMRCANSEPQSLRAGMIEGEEKSLAIIVTVTVILSVALCARKGDPPNTRATYDWEELACGHHEPRCQARPRPGSRCHTRPRPPGSSRLSDTSPQPQPGPGTPLHGQAMRNRHVPNAMDLSGMVRTEFEMSFFNKDIDV